MRYLVTAAQAKQADRETIERGTPSLRLMESAGKKIFTKLKSKISKNSKVLILVGTGGNGGDGLVIGRYLLKSGYDVTCYLLSPESMAGDCKTNYERYNGKITGEVKDEYDVIIDALFGVGLSRTLSNDVIELIDKVNSFKGLKVSVDVPSGIDATTGDPWGTYFKADILYTVQYIKTGFIRNKGLDSYKECVIIDISIEANNEDAFIAVTDLQASRHSENSGIHPLISVFYQGILLESNEWFSFRKVLGRPYLVVRSDKVTL